MSRRSKSAVVPAHLLRVVSSTAEGFPFCFLPKSCLLVFLSVRVRVVKRFLGNGKRRQPLLFTAMRCMALQGTAPNDSYGHSQETGAPTPNRAVRQAPVPLAGARRFDIVSSSFAWWRLRPPPCQVKRPPSASPSRRLALARCASATKSTASCSGDGNHRFFSRGPSCLGIAQHASPFFDQMAVWLPEHHAPGQFHLRGVSAKRNVTVFSDRQQALGVTAGADPATETSIAAHLPTVVKAFPVTHLLFHNGVSQAAQPLGTHGGAAASSASVAASISPVTVASNRRKTLQSLNQPDRQFGLKHRPARRASHQPSSRGAPGSAAGRGLGRQVAGPYASFAPAAGFQSAFAPPPGWAPAPSPARRHCRRHSGPAVAPALRHHSCRG